MGMSLMETLQTISGGSRVDATLSPLALMITIVAVDEPVALLSIAPLVWLLEVFSRDREARMRALWSSRGPIGAPSRCCRTSSSSRIRTRRSTAGRSSSWLRPRPRSSAFRDRSVSAWSSLHCSTT